MSYLKGAQRIRPIIEKAMITADDTTALEAPQRSKYWVAGEKVEPGDRRYYEPTERLYKVKEGQGHTTQADWTPDKTPAMWAVVSNGQTGTIDDPIDAARGMEYEYGLYYRDPEDNKLYLCEYQGGSAGSTITLQYLPHELVGHYFTEVTTDG